MKSSKLGFVSIAIGNDTLNACEECYCDCDNCYCCDNCVEAKVNEYEISSSAVSANLTFGDCECECYCHACDCDRTPCDS